MALWTQWRDSWQRALEGVRHRLAGGDALLQISLLGLICGILAGGVIVGFRLLVEHGQTFVLPDGQPGNYEALSLAARFALPAVGGVLIGLLVYLAPDSWHRVGVLHVMERLAYYQGRMPWRNGLMQLVGGAISLICGHSVGREGPSAHLGAVTAAAPAQLLRLPRNVSHLLAASGAAAGIAASFNIPLAGAAFALEVLFMEYTIAGFAPVILATVAATTVTRAVYGDAVAFSVPEVALASLYELPYILLAGVLAGALGAGFVWLLRTCSARSGALPVWLRPALGGAIVGVCALGVPEIMGISYDTVNAALLGEVSVLLLAALLVMKLIATALGIGLGLPGGVIGPSLVLGAALGGLLAALSHTVVPEDITTSPDGLYIAVGMGAVIAGILQAPLTGLLTIVELTGSPVLILPGMLAVVAATVTSALFRRRESVYQALMRSLGLDFRRDPITQSLRRLSVRAAMVSAVAVLPRRTTAEAIDAALDNDPRWILVRDEQAGGSEVLLAAVDLAHEREQHPEAEEIDLAAIPGERLPAVPVDLQANLQEALETLDESSAEAVYVVDQSVPGMPRVHGMLRRSDIETTYRR